MKKSIYSIVFIAVIWFGSMPVTWAAESKEEMGIDPATLSGGIVHREGYYLPRGMVIPVELRTPIDSRVNKLSDQVTAQTTEDVMIGDYVIIPAHSFLHGFISTYKRPGKWHKNPELDITFDTVSLPGESGKRRYISIKGKIAQSQIMKESEAVNNAAKTYKQRKMKRAAMGGATAGFAAWGFLERFNPFRTYGVSGMFNRAFILGSAAGGAYVATGMMERDDIRVDPGTQFQVILEEPTLETFAENHPMSHTQTKDLTAEQAYDLLNEMQALSIDES